MCLPGAMCMQCENTFALGDKKAMLPNNFGHPLFNWLSFVRVIVSWDGHQKQNLRR